MHRRTAEERIGADAKSGRELDFADHGLPIRHQRQRAVEAIDLGAADVDAIKLALEGAGVAGQLHRHIGAAHAGARRCRLQLADVETEIGEHAAHAPRARFKTVFKRGEGGKLTPLDLVERILQAHNHVVDALDLWRLSLPAH